MPADTTHDFYTMAIYILAAFLYCAILVIIDRLEYRYHKKKKTLTDEACLGLLAKKYGISEYVIFLAAAQKWNISEKRASLAFGTYLKTEVLPYYVRDFVRQHKYEVENYKQPYLPFRNNQPPACPG